MFTALNAAVNGVETQEGILDDLMAVRDANAKTLSTRLSSLIQELHMRMGGLDGRWLAFGLNKPGAFERPDQVENVLTTLLGGGVATVKWDAAARAQYYHVFKKVIGIDTEYVLIGSPADIDFNLENLPGGATIEIIVTAVNNGGESINSQVIQVVTH